MLSHRQPESSELERLHRLGQYQISRTPPEAAFDDVVELAAELFNTPIAFLCTTEAHCNWFKARIGIDLQEVPRSISFCDHTLKGEGIMVVPDATSDERFAHSPMVTGPHHIRFYAGITLRDKDGFAMGTLAVADVVPRRITMPQEISLRRLANIAIDRMELKKAQLVLNETIANLEAARKIAVSNHAELHQVIDCLPEAIVLTDSENKLILWNKNYERMFPDVGDILQPGMDYETVIRKDMKDGKYSEAIGEEGAETWLAGRLLHHNKAGRTTDLKHKDGRWIRYDQHLTPDGKRIGVRTDITDDKNAGESFRLLFDNNPVPMYVYEQSSFSFIDVNSAAVTHYGYSREEFLRMRLVDIRPPAEQKILFDHLEKLSGFSHGEKDWTHVKADGTESIMNIYARPIKHCGVDSVIVAAIDVTERRKHDARIQHLVEHDALTGLPNRRLLLELLQGALTKSALNHHHTAIILIDIDDFKDVNDTLGHHVGDNLIIGVAKRLEEGVGDQGVVARLGGDEFAVLLPIVTEPHVAHAVANDLIEEFKIPITLPDHSILVGISAGVSIGLDNSTDSSAMLKNADLALYKAKADGRGMFRLYEPQMSLQIMLRREMERDLRQALAEEQLVVHYQPLVELERGSEVGFEALVRWNHPTKGLISPSVFIPIAEASGMIVPMGNWVLDQSCRLAATLQKKLSIAVNISPAQFKSGKLVNVVSSALKKYALAPHRLELEITESLFLEKSSETLDILKSLKELGVVIALDDFGTGYSGLGYLNSFPIDKIKIDRSFIKNLGIEPRSKELVRAAINIGHSLGLLTLAEGIETQEQLDILRALGCQHGQGFLFSRAIASSEISYDLKEQDILISEGLVA